MFSSNLSESGFPIVHILFRHRVFCNEWEDKHEELNFQFWVRLSGLGYCQNDNSSSQYKG